jgi:hypothetical protein
MADQPTPPPSESPSESPEPAETEWQRRRRLAAVFGDVLPETTSDERDAEAPSDEDAQDRWLRGQVPPHHG